VVVALVVYVIASLLLREEPAPPTKTCPFCKEDVPADATKCRACTSAI
jgi:large conductance mechanosensitive channel